MNSIRDADVNVELHVTIDELDEPMLEYRMRKYFTKIKTADIKLAPHLLYVNCLEIDALNIRDLKNEEF